MFISVNTVPKHLEQNCSNTLIFVFPEEVVNGFLHNMANFLDQQGVGI